MLVVNLFTATAYESREVKISNPTAGINLAGTLLMPQSKPHAALVLTTGSGPQDRDETVFGHKPFKAIAEYLAENGYAVLRLDDRGVGESEGTWEGSTTSDFVGDIDCAVEWLDSVTGGLLTGVLGHSEGGQIAYRVANLQPSCRFIITLAGPAWRGDSLIMEQTRSLSVASTGVWTGEQAERTILDVAMSDLPEIAARPILMAEIARSMGDAAKMPQIQEFIRLQTEGLLTPWYRAFLRYDPTEDIKRVDVPWLALNGDKDVQVPVENLSTISALCPQATTVILPSHNHLFQKAVTGLPNEYEGIAEDISELTLRTILDWLNSNFSE